MTFKTNNTITIGNVEAKMAFLGSKDIFVYPCSRRSSEALAHTGSSYNNRFYIPFDAEARLNTEANHMKTASSNGFTQNYIKSWNPTTVAIKKTPAENDINNSVLPGIHLVLAGYSFYIPDQTNDSANAFGGRVCDFVGDPTATSIYANILLEKTPLYMENNGGGPVDVGTWILRNQTSTDTAAACLDRLPEDHIENQPTTDDFYFSGLSFSTTPLSTLGSDTEVDPYCVVKLADNVNDGTPFEQQVISLKILEKTNTVWTVYQPALLPHIWHDQENASAAVEYFRVHKKAQIKNDLNIEGNIKADSAEKRAVFNDVKIKGNLEATKNAEFKGTLKANTKNSQFKDVQIDNNLNVENNVDVHNQLTAKTIVAGNFTRSNGEKDLGLLTAEVVTQQSTQSLNRGTGFRTSRETRRLKIYSNAGASATPTFEITTKPTANTVNISDYQNFTLSE